MIFSNNIRNMNAIHAKYKGLGALGEQVTLQMPFATTDAAGNYIPCVDPSFIGPLASNQTYCEAYTPVSSYATGAGSGGSYTGGGSIQGTIGGASSNIVAYLQQNASWIIMSALGLFLLSEVLKRR